jgi:hypothetical protein
MSRTLVGRFPLACNTRRISTPPGAHVSTNTAYLHRTFTLRNLSLRDILFFALHRGTHPAIVWFGGALRSMSGTAGCSFLVGHPVYPRGPPEGRHHGRSFLCSEAIGCFVSYLVLFPLVVLGKYLGQGTYPDRRLGCERAALVLYCRQAHAAPPVGIVIRWLLPFCLPLTPPDMHPSLCSFILLFFWSALLAHRFPRHVVPFPTAIHA